MLTLKRPRVDNRGKSTVAKRFKPTICTHTGFLKKRCLKCRRKADEDDSLLFSFANTIQLNYIEKGLRISTAETMKLKYEDTKDVLGMKKLYLVLDLDHTLLHTTPVEEDSSRDDLLFKNPIGKKKNHIGWTVEEDSSRDDLLFKNPIGKKKNHIGWKTKLRPFVRTFLKEANDLFKMYIYTMGSRSYANTVAGFLDPEGVYFGNRIITNEDCSWQRRKQLDVVMGEESAVIILDDTQKVWPSDQKNLILIEKYFAPQNAVDERDGVLPLVLDSLKKIHTQFFEENNPEKDVRKVMMMVKKSIQP